MRNVFRFVIASIVAAALTVDKASAGEWGWSGGPYSVSPVFYAPPTYSYARPTTTVLPHYVIQPNYVVRPTYVVPQDIYVGSSPRIWRPIYNGYLLNHGQFDTDEATIPVQQYDRGYVYGVRSRYYPYYGYGAYWLPSSPRL